MLWLMLKGAVESQGITVRMGFDGGAQEHSSNDKVKYITSGFIHGMVIE